jgi:hypothetical protein
LLSCAGILVAASVLYVCTCTPIAYTMMVVPVTGTALDPALLLLFVDLLLGLFFICRMGFCCLGCQNVANFNAGLVK